MAKHHIGKFIAWQLSHITFLWYSAFSFGNKSSHVCTLTYEFVFVQRCKPRYTASGIRQLQVIDKTCSLSLSMVWNTFTMQTLSFYYTFCFIVNVVSLYKHNNKTQVRTWRLRQRRHSKMFVKKARNQGEVGNSDSYDGKMMILKTIEKWNPKMKHQKKTQTLPSHLQLSQVASPNLKPFLPSHRPVAAVAAVTLLFW